MDDRQRDYAEEQAWREAGVVFEAPVDTHPDEKREWNSNLRNQTKDYYIPGVSND